MRNVSFARVICECVVCVIRMRDNMFHMRYITYATPYVSHVMTKMFHIRDNIFRMRFNCVTSVVDLVY